MGADQNIDWKMAAASALDWWHQAGVDTLVDEVPRDWLAAVPVAAPLARAPRAGAGVAPAVTAAAPPLPDTLAAFTAWRAGPDAPESGWGGVAIPAQGVASSDIMVLTDLPEREDADSGLLVSGAAGRLFDRMLAAIGLDRASIYLVPVCTVRPAAGRIAPELADRLNEIARRHVLLARPKRVLLLGNAPSRALLGEDAMRMRGALRPVNPVDGNQTDKDVGTQAVASFHPRFLLERPSAKAEAWKDLQMLIGDLEK